MLAGATKDISTLQKKLNTKVLAAHCTVLYTSLMHLASQETEIDQKRADRHSLLKACKVQLDALFFTLYQSFLKMDDIRIPIIRGSIDDVGDEMVR